MHNKAHDVIITFNDAETCDELGRDGLDELVNLYLDQHSGTTNTQFEVIYDFMNFLKYREV